MSVVERDSVRVRSVTRDACPQHPDRKLRRDGERAWCVVCKREISDADAVRVTIAPADDWQRAVEDERQRIVELLDRRAAESHPGGRAALQRAARYVANGGQ